ncbi:MAG: alpha/beta fold hydrolase [Bacteroidia bacterium]|nr:alpha/beta fold hydrolase [Bacteroidia bacterium]
MSLYYEVHGAGPAILLIHGYMFSGQMYHPLLDYWQHHFQLIIPDLRGYGRSINLPGPYTIEQSVQDVLAIMDSLGLSHFFVVGYSKGGLVAQQLATHYPYRVKALVLACTFSHKPLSVTERLQKRFITTALSNITTQTMVKLLNKELVEALGKIDPSTLRWYKKMIVHNRKDVLLIGAHEIFKFDSRKHLKNIKVPTLVIGASDDIIVPIHHAYFLAREIPGAQIKVFSNAGHAVVHTHKDLMAEVIKNFFQQCI